MCRRLSRNSKIKRELSFQLRGRRERTFGVARYPRTRGRSGERDILAELFRRRDTVSLRRLVQKFESRGADSGIRYDGRYTALHCQELVGTVLRRQGLPLHRDRQQSMR